MMGGLVFGGGGGGVSVFTDTVTLSGAQTDWSIPENCINVKVNLTGSITSVSSPLVSLLKQSDGTDGNFARQFAFGAIVSSTPARGVGGNKNTSGAIFANIGLSTDGGLGVRLDIEQPRDPSVKTNGFWAMFGDDDEATRFGISVADAAEDHDTIRFDDPSATMSGTAQITYTIQE